MGIIKLAVKGFGKAFKKNKKTEKPLVTLDDLLADLKEKLKKEKFMKSKYKKTKRRYLKSDEYRALRTEYKINKRNKKLGLKKD